MPRVNFPFVLILVGGLTTPGRTRETRAAIDEVIHPWVVAIVDTPTPPSGSHRIDLSRWEDLLRAAELLGRPILRVEGGEGGPDGRLFYVADGPQSYVFGFPGASLDLTRSGAYAPAPPVRAPITAPPEAAPAERAEVEATPISSSWAPPKVLAALPLRAVPAPVARDTAEDAWGADVPEPLADVELPSATVVERRIREMIHELLVDFRKLPPSSDRLELGTEHIQRAIDMLHLGRYGVAQIELNKAGKLLPDEDPRS